ncbi:MAG: signal peptidase II [Myxococcales bacterium FL481]|nr:MAG: signal peptidase II [Myxococcales bacterium FL481]
MTADTPRKIRTRLAWFGITAIAGGGCDLQTKSWAERALSDRPGQSLAIIDPWLEFDLAYNRGTAFSVVRDLGDARWFFGVLALVVVAVLVINVVRWQAERRELLGLGAIAGGAIGNGVDRLIHLSAAETGVVDFIKVNYPWGGSWPTFNVADILIAVGAGLLLLGSAIRRKSPEAPPNAAPSAAT